MKEIVAYAASAEAMYDYQLFEIVRWFGQNQPDHPQDLLDLCRKWRADKNRAPWLRSWCLDVLAASGDAADLEEIEHSYVASATELEKAEIVAALLRVEPGRRNAFYKRIQDDGDLIRRAVTVARASRRTA